MAQGSFAAQVSAWVAETKERMVAVRNESVERVIEVAQTTVAKGGNMPVDTGFLRSSLMGAVGAANFASVDNPNPKAPKGSFKWSPQQTFQILGSAELKDTIEFVYTANYARVQEYVAKGTGHRFVGLAAQQWPQIVEQVCAEAKSRAGG